MQLHFLQKVFVETELYPSASQRRPGYDIRDTNGIRGGNERCTYGLCLATVVLSCDWPVKSRV